MESAKVVVRSGYSVAAIIGCSVARNAQAAAYRVAAAACDAMSAEQMAGAVDARVAWDGRAKKILADAVKAETGGAR